MTTINAKALQELLAETLEDMADGGLGNDTFGQFQAFTMDYPNSAWLADYRRLGGTASDDEDDEVYQALKGTGARPPGLRNPS